MPKRKSAPSPWSHAGLERRGYKKCPLCWRHLVKIEEHIAGHEAGLIGPDGKRQDRSLADQERWAARYSGSPASRHARQPRRTFVPRAEYERVLRLPSIDLAALRKEVDSLADQEP
ncbi:MAG TPA: hypothetical protein VGT60_02325 [Candidatus Limnocylindria bacterium]|nr:hypothetical protein [Candidatus Limnocylindria bacterium]